MKITVAKCNSTYILNTQTNKKDETMYKSNLIDTNTFRQIAQDYRASGQEQTAQDYENAAACIDCLRAELKSKNQFIAFNTGLKLGGARV